MIRKAIIPIVLLLVSLVVLSGCAARVSQEIYDAMVTERDTALAEIVNLEAERDAAQAELVNVEAERDAAQAEIANLEVERDTTQAEIDSLGAEIASLEAEIDDLEEQIDVLTTLRFIEEAWDTAEYRYRVLREDLEFDAEGSAPWLRLFSKPTWFNSVHLSSATLVDEPPTYEAVCLIKRPNQRMLSILSEDTEVTSMISKGGSQDYEMTITRDEDGNISKMSMTAGESWVHLDWTTVGELEYLTAQVNGRLKSFIWSSEPDEFEDIFLAMTSWLEEIDETGGLIEPSDRPLMFLALGELSKPPRAEFVVDWAGVARRVTIDLFCGIPAGFL